MERAVSKLKNDKAVGSDEIAGEMVKNGGQVVGAAERSLEDKGSTSRMEKCHPDSNPQEERQESVC